MGRLRQRQRSTTRPKRLRAMLSGMYKAAGPAEAASVIPLDVILDITKRTAARWHGGPTVIAFLFGMPDSDAIRLLDARGEYFDVRTGDTWDLFFPGYFQAEKTGSAIGARPVGRNYTRGWRFSARDFDAIRQYVEDESGRRWEYSGGTDLVLINCWLPDRGEPTIDWASIISGHLTDRAEGTRSLTLANIIERITGDLIHAIEDPAYGVSDVTRPSLASPEKHMTRDIMVNALGGIAASLTPIFTKRIAP